MDVPPTNAGSSGVLFARAALKAPSVKSEASGPTTAPPYPDETRLFGFESELEANLTYMPMAVRFKLDKCGIKLSLEQWQRLPLHRRRELLRTPCDHAAAISNYRLMLRSMVMECTGEEPPTIRTAERPQWADHDAPEQVRRAATAMGLESPSPARWRSLSALERFALVKLSRDGRDHRNLGPALREFGFTRS